MSKNLENQALYNSRKVNSTNTWLLFLLFGYSYGNFNEWGKQILYWMTLGGFGMWGLYVLFNLNKKINAHNTKVAVMLGMDKQEMLANGLI